MKRTGNYKKPQAVEIITTELCDYGCGGPARYKFTNGKMCCQQHQNSCLGKRKEFSDRTDHKERVAKSLKTRIELGITKTSQIKGGETRRRNGHYKKLAVVMRDHWNTHPWQNNPRCLIIPYKDTPILYQGSFEFNFLEQLERKFGNNWLLTNVKRGPAIWYMYKGEKRLYISDFQIDNTIYEIKSKWTWNKHGTDLDLEELNKAKLSQCHQDGYNVVLVLNGEMINYGDL